MSGAMDSRERLARVIFCNVSVVRKEYPPIVRGVLWEAAYQVLSSEQTLLGDWPHKAADAILSSDWLRDTLAAERRAGFIAGRDAAAQKVADEDVRLRGNLNGGGLHTAIRNLEPEANDGRD